MAEGGYLFGGTVADFVVVADPDTGELTLGAEKPVWFYNAGVGGDRYVTGLTDLSGETITEVISDSTGAIGQFRGPENVPYLWADASEGDGPRRLMVPADLGNFVTGLRSAILDLQAAVDLLQNSAGVLKYDPQTHSWPPRPSDPRMYIWVGPSAPAEIPDGDLFVNTQP